MRNPTNVILTGVASGDLVTMIAYGIYAVYLNVLTAPSPDEYTHSLAMVRVILITQGLILGSHTFSTVLLVVLAVLRCRIMYVVTLGRGSKSHGKTGVQPNAQKRIVLVGFAVGIVLGLTVGIPVHFIYEIELRPHNQTSQMNVTHSLMSYWFDIRPGADGLEHGHFVLNGVFVKILASVLIFVLTSFLLVTMRIAEKHYQELQMLSGKKPAKLVQAERANTEDLTKTRGRKVVPKFRRRAQTTFFGPTPPDVALQSYRTVYFRVRFYIPLHCLRERDTQHLYYEQLRTNLLEYGLYCDLATYLELAALALQAEYGNAPTDCLDEELNGQTIPVYFDPEGIYPHQMLQEYSREGLLRMTFRRHMALQDMPRRSAEFHFIRLGSKRTSNFNKHLYKLAPMSQSNFTVWLGVSPDGIELHQERVLIVHLYARKTVRKFQFEHGLSSKHMFALVSHMHFFQLRAELSAPYSAGLLEHIEDRQLEQIARKFSEEVGTVLAGT
ncbi:FERM central domain protein, partial [Opisthorchis viverrini]